MCGFLHPEIKQSKKQRCYKTSSVASREVTAINIKTNFPAVGYLWRSAICVTTVWFAGGHYYRVLPVYPGASPLLDYCLRASSILLHRDDGQNIFISGCVKAILIPNVWIDCNEIVTTSVLEHNIAIEFVSGQHRLNYFKLQNADILNASKTKYLEWLTVFENTSP